MCGSIAKTKLINISKVKENLHTRVLGHPLLYFQAVPSTNDLARELGTRNAPEGTVIIAETQAKGKGRLNRKWISPQGGLWFSIVLRPKTDLRHAPKITLMASVAVAKSISRLFPLKTEIKWPNDVLINNKKICGILTKAQTKRNALDFVIVGIGINTNFQIDSLPRCLRWSSTTLKEELSREVDREILLCSVIEETEVMYDTYLQADFDVILRQWRNFASLLGSQVQIVSGKERVEGWAIDLDDDGALILKLEDQTMLKITTGDLKIIRRLNQG